jgi:alpha-amylase
VFNTPVQERGAAEEQLEYAPGRPPTYAYPAFRDIDHTDWRVRRDLIRYLLQLRSFGYRGRRYDMVLGYHARWIAVYNRASAPTFSVGEYWDAQAAQCGWVWHCAVVPGDLRTPSSAFDFSTHFSFRITRAHTVHGTASATASAWSATPPTACHGRAAP